MSAEILIDLDGICADLLGEWLALINVKMGQSFKVNDVTEWDMTNIAKAGDVDEILKTPGFFRALKPIPGALQTIEWLNNKHHVTIVTAGNGVPEVYADKVAWVQRHLPFLKKRQLVTMHEKWRIPADVIIDDKPSTAVKYRDRHPSAHILSLGYPYNINCPAYNLLPAWDEPSKGWQAMYDYIEQRVS
jgi:5'(3')-deoxyribonucleotidase